MTTLIISPPGTSETSVLSAYDQVIEQLATGGPTPDELQRVVNKMRSDLIDQLGQPEERASLLAEATLYDGKPDLINDIPGELQKVTPVEVKNFAREFLVARNRTIIERIPAPQSASQPLSPAKGK